MELKLESLFVLVAGRKCIEYLVVHYEHSLWMRLVRRKSFISSASRKLRQTSFILEKKTDKHEFLVDFEGNKNSFFEESYFLSKGVMVTSTVCQDAKSRRGTKI